jgi:hypothetical protein
MIGDGTTMIEDKRPLCHKCWSSEEYSSKTSGYYRPSEQYPIFEAAASNAKFHDTNRHKKRRHTNSNGMQHSTSVPLILPHDGPLDSESVYTAYLDAIGNLDPWIVSP